MRLDLLGMLAQIVTHLIEWPEPLGGGLVAVASDRDWQPFTVAFHCPADAILEAAGVVNEDTLGVCFVSLSWGGFQCKRAFRAASENFGDSKIDLCRIY